MNKKYIISLLSTCLLFTSNARANTPPDLTYSGKPIDSLCFYNPENNIQSIDLKNCGIKQAKYTRKGENPDLIKQGFIGYNWHDPSISVPVEGYSYYQFFPIEDKKYWLYTVNSGGGSGEFTAVSMIERKNENTILIKDIAGGDRCNGGVEDVLSKDKQLTFSVNITPYDVTQLASDKLTNVKDYDDLAACAACCVAKAVYSVDANNTTPQLLHIDLGKPMNPDELPDQGKYGKCFNELLSKFADKENRILSQDKINAFVTEFNHTCVK